MFCPITGCSGMLENQLSQHEPRLHEVVPTEYAVMPPVEPQFTVPTRSPTITSGVFVVSVHDDEQQEFRLPFCEPSSHCSPVSTVPLPQAAWAAGAKHSVAASARPAGIVAREKEKEEEERKGTNRLKDIAIPLVDPLDIPQTKRSVRQDLECGLFCRPSAGRLTSEPGLARIQPMVAPLLTKPPWSALWSCAFRTRASGSESLGLFKSEIGPSSASSRRTALRERHGIQLSDRRVRGNFRVTFVCEALRLEYKARQADGNGGTRKSDPAPASRLTVCGGASPQEAGWMAEAWNVAFGHYLRTLRERRGLSLHDVSSLSQAFAETLNKGYLSRCENGLQRLAFSKIIPLSRIYQVSADVLLERAELDMELERVGGPDTEGMDFSSLTVAGTEALHAGYRWKAYGYLRDAVSRARVDPVRPAFSDSRHQFVSAQVSCGTAGRSLGRYRYALHEYLFAKETGALNPRSSLLLLERLASVHLNLGDLDRSRYYADQAMEAAERCDCREYMGVVLLTRARIAHRDKDMEFTTDLYEKAYRALRDTGQHHACALVLNNLGQVYFDLGRYQAALRAVTTCQNMARLRGHHRLLALSLILQGDIEAMEHREQAAERRWTEAAAISRKLNDPVLRFKAELPLLKQAHRRGNAAVVRAIWRRLQRLSNYIPGDTPELQDFRDYARQPAS